MPVTKMKYACLLGAFAAVALGAPVVLPDVARLQVAHIDGTRLDNRQFPHQSSQELDMLPLTHLSTR